MSDKVEQLFSRLRQGPWYNSPNAVPQEGLPGNGNPESTGWLADGSVTADVIQANTITANEIAAGTITSNEIAANTITAADIAANTITANEIAANTITAAEIAANTITANEIAASTITATELAADSVTTNKILAGSVTSSRIEATLSGKRYGADSGSSSAPGFFFDSATTTGMYWSGSAIGFSVGSAANFSISATGNTSAQPLVPSGSGVINLGLSGQRWATVYCVTLDQSSDERLKADIADLPLGLDFVNELRPREFRWAASDDGLHAGLVAQEVKAVLDRLGVDYAFWREGEGGQSLSYTELIAPMLRAIQELSDRLDAVERH